MVTYEEIKGEVYKALIEYACKNCDAVMFVIRNDYSNEKEIKKKHEMLEEIKQRFKKSILKYRNGPYWVFSKVGYSELNIKGFSDPPGFDKKFHILFLKLDEEVKDYLLANKKLFAWDTSGIGVLEDTSFFKEGYCWLYSVTHEGYCVICCRDESEYEYLKSIGINFNDKEFSPISKDYLYYEDYGLNSKKDNKN